MVKQKTKEQREAEEREALRNEIFLIFCGAKGENITCDDEEILLAEDFARAISTIRDFYQWDNVDEGTSNGWMFDCGRIGEYSTVSSTVDFLYKNDVRATV
jgi:hypothetical protein